MADCPQSYPQADLPARATGDIHFPRNFPTPEQAVLALLDLAGDPNDFGPVPLKVSASEAESLLSGMDPTSKRRRRIAVPMLTELVEKCLRFDGNADTGLVVRNLAFWMDGKPPARRLSTKEIFYLVNDAVDAKETSAETAAALGCPLKEDHYRNGDTYWYIRDLRVAVELLAKLTSVS